MFVYFIGMIWVLWSDLDKIWRRRRFVVVAFFWVTLCRLDIDFQITMHRPESDT
jgi:hypothetical protein